MTPDEMKQEAESFFNSHEVQVPMHTALAFAKHCVDKATAWRPIAEAPKDGTVIDLWVDGSRSPDCYWQGEDECHDYGRWIQKYAEAPNNGFMLDGEPTHWMPTPPPPEAA